jgi:hypothetical protein
MRCAREGGREGVGVGYLWPQRVSKMEIRGALVPYLQVSTIQELVR